MSRAVPPPPGAPPGGPRRSQPSTRSRTALPYVFLAVAVVFSALCGILATRMVQTHNANPISSVVELFVPPPESVFGKDRIYVALLGLDYNTDDRGMQYSKNSRTDKISIYALDFPTRVVKEIAVPRDMEALVAGHQNKINAAYSIGGEKMTDAVVGQFLGLTPNDKGTYFDRFITLRIDATKDFIDAIGGINVTVAKEMNYDDNWGHLHIHFHPGPQHMNGDQAVSYARFRHDECGDPCRIERQQQVTKLAISKLKAEKFNDLAHIAQLIGVVNRNVITNLSTPEMTSLAWHFKDINLADVHSAQVPYTEAIDTDYAGNMLVPDAKARAQMVADFTGPFVAETPPPAPGPIPSIAPSKVHIAVQNGSGESGLGMKMAATLRKLGFVVDSVANADAFTYDTTLIQEHSKVTGVGQRVRADLALKSAAVSPAPAASPAATDATDVTVIVGRDFATALAAPAVLDQKGATPQ